MYASKPYTIDDLVRYTPNNQYSSLNYMISESENHGNTAENPNIEYKGHHQKLIIYSENNYLSQEKPIKTYYFTPDIFLKPVRHLTQFINTTEQIQNLIEETFKLMLGKKLPNNISIQVCNEEELKQIHSKFGLWDNRIQGFALNKQIFVKNNNLDALILTIGHEIGHAYTRSLDNNHDEEAKAFSFALEWAKIIKKHNIGNLKDNLDFNPAKNGLHDLAFIFVKNLVDKGLKPMEVHWDLVNKYISLFNFYI